MRGLLSLCFLVGINIIGCGESSTESTRHDSRPTGQCEGLYGAPNEKTGVTDAQCFPYIGTAASWAPPVWTPSSLAALRSWTLLDPPPVPQSDPYDGTVSSTKDAVCGAQMGSEKTYRLETFESYDAALNAGAVITHGGACGLCSSLKDLAAYAATPDLTEPVRDCGLRGGLNADIEAIDSCIQEEVGFTPACARIWAYNTRHTRSQCLDVCIELLDAPYLNADGTLNGCIQCDEDKSGPVFKSVAGRTRRNSGLATALCRPCETVWRLEHRY